MVYQFYPDICPIGVHFYSGAYKRDVGRLKMGMKTIKVVDSDPGMKDAFEAILSFERHQNNIGFREGGW